MGSIADGAIPAEGTPQRRLGGLAPLVATGVVVEGLLFALALLYVNFPAGHNVIYGLSPQSVSLFRALWAYPVLSLSPQAFMAAATLTLIGLWAVYIVAARLLWKQAAGVQRQFAVVVFCFALLFNATLVIAMPPVLSADIFNYAVYGRMVSFYGLNPYATTGSALGADPILPLVVWTHETSRYGPTWILISAGVASLGGQSVILTVLVFKSVMALFNLANCLLVYHAAKRLHGDGLGALLLYSWNPLILVETAGSGHNDAAMMTFALLGLVLTMRGRLLIGFAALVVSVLVKYVTALLVVLVIARNLAGSRTWRQAALLGSRLAGMATLLVGALYLPFLLHLDSPMQLLSGLSPSLNSLTNPLRRLLPQWVGSVLPGAGEGGQALAVESYITPALQLGFAVLVLIGAWVVSARKVGWSRLVNVWGLISLIFILVIYGGMYPWYLVPVLTIGSLGPPSRTNDWLMAITTGVAIALMALYAQPRAI